MIDELTDALLLLFFWKSVKIERWMQKMWRVALVCIPVFVLRRVGQVVHLMHSKGCHPGHWDECTVDQWTLILNWHTGIPLKY